MTISPNDSPRQIEAVIERLGRSGDGVMNHEGQSFYLPGTLPGEEVRVRLSGDAASPHAELVARESDSPERVSPPCGLFGLCGGCALQFMSLPSLLRWKVERVRQALQQAGYENLPEPKAVQASPQTRRRMDFVLQRVKGGVILGLHRRQGEPVDLSECSLLHPVLFNLLAPLRGIFGQLGALTGRGGLMINLLESGPDITLETSSPLSGTDKSKLASFAREHKIPRIAWRKDAQSPTETIVQWEPVYQNFGSVKVSPPSACFLQASKESENALVQTVLSGLPALNRKDRIYELYAGCGTLTFPLAEKGSVRAYEGYEPSAESLKAASHHTRVEAFARDLNRQPLLPQDLKLARIVVLDPPYNGADKQIPHLARSDIKDIIYVSCNPVALTKDLIHLQKAGFAVLDWTVIDQFLWSTEVESVIILTRDAKRLKKSGFIPKIS